MAARPAAIETCGSPEAKTEPLKSDVDFGHNDNKRKNKQTSEQKKQPEDRDDHSRVDDTCGEQNDEADEDFTLNLEEPIATDSASAIGDQNGGESKPEVGDETSALPAGQLSSDFSSLALKFRRSMNLYGLFEDVTLLLDPKAHEQPTGELALGKGTSCQLGPIRRRFGKLISLLLVLTANLLATYVLLAHFVWEYRMLGGGGSGGRAPSKSGASMLKDFLENVRRHLARFFSLGLTITWHLGCHEIERLFADCQRYYSLFYNRAASIMRTEEDETGSSGASGKFYKLARRRINLALWLPLLHYLFNVLSVSLFPSSSSRRVTRRRSFGENSLDSTEGSTLTGSGFNWTTLVELAGQLLAQALDNFDSFHSAIHTAFHPYDHRIGVAVPETDQPQNQSEIKGSGQVSVGQSAIYCLIELFVYSMYFNGPRIICATCLSLVLHIHYQCIRAFGQRLLSYIRRPKGEPMGNEDIVSLVKQYDLIVMMHERIERTFKWSIVLWYALMFISCLMHIFSFTESTSAYVLSSNSQAANGQPIGTNSSSSALILLMLQRNSTTGEATQLPAINEQQQTASGTSSSSLAVMFIRLASVFFVCYSPCLVYSEAFKIESASARVEQLVMRLARRQDDPLAQAIEPALFEPVYLSVGGYFDLTKKSMTSFLGAVVTFSVMFIASDSESSTRDERPKWTFETGSGLSAVGPDAQTGSGGQMADDEEEEDDDDDDLNGDLEEDNEREEEGEDDLIGVEDDDSFLGGGRRLGIQRPPTGNGTLREQSAQRRRVVSRFRQKLQQKQEKEKQQQNLDNYPNRKSEDFSPESTTAAPAPALESLYLGKVHENERLVELEPILKVLNQVEVCDFELLPFVASGERHNNSDETSPSISNNDADFMPFAISWIDRVRGEASMESRGERLMDCERQRNYTFKIRAIGCNGLNSNEASVTVIVEDANEFSPEFERQHYATSIDSHQFEDQFDPDKDPINGDEDLIRGTRSQREGQPKDNKLFLLQVRAKDRDCSPEFGSICRYELLPVAHEPSGQQSQQLEALSVDTEGRIWMSVPRATSGRSSGAGSLRRRQVRAQGTGGDDGDDNMASNDSDKEPGDSKGDADNNRQAQEFGADSRRRRQPQIRAPITTQRLNFQVLAYDCGSKKSPSPAQVQIQFSRPKICQPKLREVDTRIVYRAASGERWPFLRTKLDLCASSCHRPNISLALRLEAAPPGGETEPEVATKRSSAEGGNDLFADHGSGGFHCDRDTYSMVSKRRLCGAATNKAIELLPATYFSYYLTSSALGEGTGNASSSLEQTAEAPSAEEDTNLLGAYSLDGAYFRRAIQQLQSPGVGIDSLPQQFRGRDTLPRRRQQQQPRRKFARRRPRPQVPTSGPQSRHLPPVQSATRQPRALDSSSSGSGGRPLVYRDQVFRFDGQTSAALLPAQLLSWHKAAQTENSTRDNFLFGSKHTISFWMRHSDKKSNHGNIDIDLESSNREADNQKEHLLCATFNQENPSGSQTGSPRYYYAVSVQNCKLNLLMRRTFSRTGSENSTTGQQEFSSARGTYLPGEWRWSLAGNEACDNKWHVYTINVDYPNVELYIDGNQFEESSSYQNLAIIDHLPEPLPVSTSNGINQQIDLAKPTGSSVVYETTDGSGQHQLPVAVGLGGCYEAGSRGWFGHFRGSLSGLILLPGENDDSRTIECLGACSEALVSTSGSRSGPSTSDSGDWPPMQDQQQEQEVNGQRRMRPSNSLISYQESQSRILLHGHEPEDLEEALTRIAYLNKRQLPSIGRRSIVLEAGVDCHRMSPADSGSEQHPSFSSKRLDPVRVEVSVQPGDWLPLISISGTVNLAREYGPFVQGIRPFASVSLRLRRLDLRRVAASRSQRPLPEAATDQLKGQAASVSRNSTNDDDAADYIEDAGNLHPQEADEVDQLDERTAARTGSGRPKVRAGRGWWRRVEACSVQVMPPLNPLHESLHLPMELIDRNQLYWRQSYESLMVYGADSADTYEQILRSIVYKNQRPIYYVERVFKLLCSDLNGRLLSNEYLQTVTIIHDTSEATVSATGSLESMLANSNGHFSDGSRPSMLRQSTHAGHLVLDGFSEESAGKPLISGHGGRRLDRIITAFLVFVASLLVLMLIIALTNLIKEDPVSHTHDRKRRSNSCASEEDEEEDLPESCLRKRELEENEWMRRRRWLSERKSWTQQNELLVWDEEAEETASCSGDDELYHKAANSTTIVMNPMDQLEQQGEEPEVVRSLVTEQRPDWRGRMSRAPSCHLSLWAPELNNNDDCEDDDEGEEVGEDEEEEEVEVENEDVLFERPNRLSPISGADKLAHPIDRDQLAITKRYADHECCSSVKSFSSSSSLSSASGSSGSGSSDEDDVEEEFEPINHCHHHHMHHLNHHLPIDEEEEEDDDEDDMTEPEEQVQHAHFHHRCLKQAREPNTHGLCHFRSTLGYRHNQLEDSSEIELPTTGSDQRSSSTSQSPSESARRRHIHRPAEQLPPPSARRRLTVARNKHEAIR